MKAELETGQDGYVSVAVRAEYGIVGRMTPLEAEEFIKQLREVTNQASSANKKPQKFGDH